MRKVRIPKSLITRPPSSLIYSCEIKSRRRSVIAHACGTTDPFISGLSHGDDNLILNSRYLLFAKVSMHLSIS